jgi:hypothetical protein
MRKAITEKEKIEKEWNKRSRKNFSGLSLTSTLKSINLVKNWLRRQRV